MSRLAGLAMAIGLLVAHVPALADGVTLAIRVDAPPFAERTETGEYEGLLVELCERAVSRAGYETAERRPMTAGQRARIISDSDVDLVCDPMTITLARARIVDFSPIIFVANSGFYRTDEPHFLNEEEANAIAECREMRADDPDRPLVGVGMVGSTTADATYRLAREQNILGDTLDYGLCRVAFETHTEGVAALCQGTISFYFGDLDIIRAEIGRKEECSASRHDGFGAYEPYALAIPSTDDMFRRAFVGALYGLYSDGSILSVYRDAVDTDRLSAANEMLFGLYNLPRGKDGE